MAMTTTRIFNFAAGPAVLPLDPSKKTDWKDPKNNVDPATPKKWVPWVKRGIEAWQEAFEAAGFRNAVQVKDEAGFVVNALLFPYLNSAVRLLERGVASQDDIDSAMKAGANMPMGPFALIDLVGVDVTQRRSFDHDRNRLAESLGRSGRGADADPVAALLQRRQPCDPALACGLHLRAWIPLRDPDRLGDPGEGVAGLGVLHADPGHDLAGEDPLPQVADYLVAHVDDAVVHERRRLGQPGQHILALLVRIGHDDRPRFDLLERRRHAFDDADQHQEREHLEGCGEAADHVARGRVSRWAYSAPGPVNR